MREPDERPGVRVVKNATLMIPEGNTDSELWDTLTSALGRGGVTVERRTIPAAKRSTMRSPEEVAREWLRQGAERMVSPGDAKALLFSVADLLRQRDAEHAERLREERGRLWDAGAAAQEELASVVFGLTHRPGEYTRRDVDEATADFDAARRAAVESAGEPGEEQHGD